MLHQSRSPIFAASQLLCLPAARRFAVRKSDGAAVSVKFYSKMEDFNRERELLRMGLEPKYIPALLEAEVRARAPGPHSDSLRESL